MIRLFLSTDVAGSTLYKATRAHQADGGWIGIFRHFFSTFPFVMVGQVGLAFMDEEDLPKVSVWKVMGDEIILTAEPRTAEQAVLLVAALGRAMAAYEEEYFAGLPMRLKGTAWLARFPEPNIEIEIPELSDERRGGYVDFIGPDIDLGFRVSKFTRPSAVALSLDLAEVALNAANADALDLYLVGREELKGVLFGRPYPVIWARPSGLPPAFMPWEVDDCPLTARAAEAGPSDAAKLGAAIDAVRAYLAKMHGAAWPPLSFD
jgi:hypothetical protein